MPNDDYINPVSSFFDMVPVDPQRGTYPPTIW